MKVRPKSSTIRLCIECKSDNVEEIVIHNKIIYHCLTCGVQSGQAFVLDGKIRILKTSRGIKHINTAAIIIRDSKILLIDRRTYPYGLAIPAGHLEYDETLEQALEREVYEELGLKVRAATLLNQLEQPVSYCRYGADIEEWIVYSISWEGEPVISNNEGTAIHWLPLSSIKPDLLSPHTRYALSELGYIHDYNTQPN